MDEQELTQKKKGSIYLRPRYPHKIDASKIKSLEDVIKILGLMDIRLDDKAVQGLEHLIMEEDK
ncbi:TPA: hypothetical protein ACR3Z0_006112 [Bacillus thuringiensis]|uniref:Uncharacterized protein n=1 Tax=Bacillus thuringiensis TaxID=1428 RepID=A0A9X6KNR5_BACTU|nr:MULTISPECIES: hypothetical protein [Bacillus cereus group]AQY37894.1 hypothetical protein B4918_07670 [Bacillus thuringiensis]ETE89066.1 hypothetical protein C621_0226480 [Bacillus thuringiensis serovar aizawai str. Leapi01]ETE96323.1 hypothetical protein C623_0220015 [Bacillus thuringiensis serovar aizawai str. Hu4-2]KAB1374288.1 hypothetical protein FPG93_28395 [Bacillus thuringiensis]KLA33494.1 hypothetical protein B4158_5969 [Bacillus cereus]